VIQGISNSTTHALMLALDAASLRHQTIANNIANVNTPGYTPLKVNFEEQLAAYRRALDGDERAMGEALRNVKGFVEQDMSAVAEGETKLMLDMEVAKLSQNVVHYQSLLRVLNGQMSIVTAAINEGRR